MKLADFAAQRNVSKDTITAYIRRNPEKFSGHVVVNNRRITIDDEALDILEKKYPLPQPIQVIEDIETVRELTRAQEKLSEMQALVIQLQQKIVDQTAIVAQAETMKVLLEDKEKQLSDKQAELDAYRKEAEQQKEEINRLRSRSLWQRIRNV